MKPLIGISVIALYGALNTPSIDAATVDLNYPLSGGAVFLGVSGTPSASVTFSVYGLSYTQVVTGSVSGATSWNIAGDMAASVDTNGSIMTTPTMSASRRAGTITVSFPVLSLGGLVNFDLSGTMASQGSHPMQLGGEGAVLLNNTDWQVAQDYTVPSGLGVSAYGQNIDLPLVLPEILNLENQFGQSVASLVTPSGVGTIGGLVDPEISAMIQAFEYSITDAWSITALGCQYTGLLGNCVVSVDAISADFNGVTLSVSSLAATGSSSTLLPAVVPVPATVWLFGSGLLALVGMERRTG